MAVGQYHDRLLPPHVTGWLDILFFHLGEVMVSFSCFMLKVAHECLFMTEARSQFLGIGQVTPSVIADIQDQSIA